MKVKGPMKWWLLALFLASNLLVPLAPDNGAWNCVIGLVILLDLLALTVVVIWGIAWMVRKHPVVAVLGGTLVLVLSVAFIAFIFLLMLSGK